MLDSFGSTYPKIGTIQRRLAWPLHKDDMQIHEGFHIFMEFRKMVTITLYVRQQKRHRCIEQSFGLWGRGRGCVDLGEWH